MRLYLTKRQISPEDYEESSFIFPEKYDLEPTLEILLNSIKNQSYGFWYRVKRELVKVGKFYPTVRKEYKYIVTHDDNDQENMFIFSKNVDHDTLFEVLFYIPENGTESFQRKVSAGFTDLKTCYGRSETLQLSSREKEDTALLLKYLEEK